MNRLLDEQRKLLKLGSDGSEDCQQAVRFQILKTTIVTNSNNFNTTETLFYEKNKLSDKNWLLVVFIKFWFSLSFGFH